MSGVLMVNHWHDDNKGDSAITLATLDLLAPEGVGTVRISSLLSAGDRAYPHAFRHVLAARPDVQVGPSLVPTVGAGTGPLAVARWILGWIPLIALMACGIVPARIGRVISAADRLVLIGGSNVFDSGHRAPLSTLRLLQVLYPAWAAGRLGVPVDLFGHTLGPFRTRASRWLVTRVLRSARSVVLREALSLELVRSLDPELVDRCRVEPDTAFAIRQPTPQQVSDVAHRHGLTQGRTLVLVPRRHPYHGDELTERVLREMAGAGSRAVASGAVDRIVVLSQCLGPNPLEDDRAVAARLAAMLPAERRVLIEEDFSVVDLVALFAGASAVLSVRLHGAILAMAAGTPAHAIAYFTAKTSGVLEQCGLGERWSEFEEFTAAHVDGLLETSLRDAVEGVARRERTRLEDLASVLC